MNLNIESNQRTNFLEFIKKEIVLIISVSLAILSCIFSVPKLSYIDFNVLILLFNLMIVVSSFNELKVLDSIATKILKGCTSYTSITFTLVFITLISSMFVTNDVALITFVPLTIIIGKKANFNPMKIIIFQTIAANLGSSFTPMGNPQNLFIYSFYKLDIIDFFKSTFPLLLISIILLIFFILKEKNKKLKIQLKTIDIKNKKEVIVFSILFFIILLSVFHLADYRFTFLITILTVLLFNKSLFFKVDYSLLLTFIGFFVFIGNISTLDSVKNFMEQILNSKQATFTYSIIVSQVISNVPATMLLSGFTNSVRELLLGVNIGGLGTLIASLASVISFKLYSNEFPEESNSYLRSFTFYNILGLAIIIPLIYLILFCI
ncbi:SLC13 family permease [Clostridium sp. C8]|uniref:SLC13 family permease n=1 Tax=Clostridium sp. C8 TaxID=1667357 RepID=UPI00062E7FA9|nr:SLC13 family permease [Clostridium sp. C8]KLE14259.1 arsenic transporter [Clostridium sp. C8]